MANSVNKTTYNTQSGCKHTALQNPTPSPPKKKKMKEKHINDLTFRFGAQTKQALYLLHQQDVPSHDLDTHFFQISTINCPQCLSTDIFSLKSKWKKCQLTFSSANRSTKPLPYFYGIASARKFSCLFIHSFSHFFGCLKA